MALNGMGSSFIFCCFWPEMVPMIMNKINIDDTEVVIDKLAGVYYGTCCGG